MYSSVTEIFAGCKSVFVSEILPTPKFGYIDVSDGCCRQNLLKTTHVTNISRQSPTSHPRIHDVGDRWILLFCRQLLKMVINIKLLTKRCHQQYCHLLVHSSRIYFSFGLELQGLEVQTWLPSTLQAYFSKLWNTQNGEYRLRAVSILLPYYFMHDNICEL